MDIKPLQENDEACVTAMTVQHVSSLVFISPGRYDEKNM